jgi:hypothetical protein
MVIQKCSIVQIIPASGWKAVWEDVDSEEESEFVAPLVCWALMEDPDGQRFITGLNAEPGASAGFVAADDNFKGYISPGGNRQEGSAPSLE